MRKFKHNKTGLEYELVQENLLFKDISEIDYETDDMNRPIGINMIEYEWRGKSDEHLVLYKALYDNPDGPYFVRHADDFFKNFTEIC